MAGPRTDYFPRCAPCFPRVPIPITRGWICTLTGMLVLVCHLIAMTPASAQEPAESRPEPALECSLDGTDWLPSQAFIQSTGLPVQIQTRFTAPENSPLVGSTRAVRLHAKLVRVADNRTLFQQTKALQKRDSLSWNPVEWELPAVIHEGVCSWQIRAEQEGEHAWSRFSKPSPITQQNWCICIRKVRSPNSVEESANAIRDSFVPSLSPSSGDHPSWALPMTWKTIDTLTVSGSSSLRSIRDLEGTVHRWTSTIRLGSVGRWLNRARLPSLSQLTPNSAWSNATDSKNHPSKEGEAFNRLAVETSDSLELTPWPSGEKIRMVFPTDMNASTIHRITVSFRKDAPAVLALRSMQVASPSNVAQVHDARKHSPLEILSNQTALLDECSFLVQPQNGLVDVELANLGRETIGLASVSLQAQVPPSPTVDSPESIDAPSARGSDPNIPPLYIRLNKDVWLSQLTQDINEDYLSEQYGAAVARTHRITTALTRLENRLAIYGSNGVILQPSDLQQTVAFQGGIPWTMRDALHQADIGIISEEIESAENSIESRLREPAWPPDLAGILFKKDESQGNVADDHHCHLVLRPSDSSSTPTSLAVTIASRGLFPIGEHSPPQKAVTPNAPSGCALLLRTLPLSSMPQRESAFELTFGHSTVQDVHALLGQHTPQAILLDCSLACFPVSDQFAHILNRARTPLSVPPDVLSANTNRDHSLDVVSEQIAGADESNHTVLVHASKTESDRFASLNVSVFNAAPWPSRVTLRCDRPSIWNLEPDAKPSGSVSSLPTMTQDVMLEAGQWTNLNVRAVDELGANPQGQPLQLLPWSSTFDGGPDAISAIQWSVTRVVERIGLLDRFSHESYRTYDRCGFEDTRLSNGGFEQSGNVGLAGWVHAQFPSDAVRVDEDQAWEGRRSIRLWNEAGTSNRAWLVSEAIPAPPSGRLAVTAAVRGQSENTQAGTVGSQRLTKLKLRVTLEGVHNDKPIRRSMEVELDNNGKWIADQILMETHLLPPETETYRLAIDSLTPGTIWLDDVQIHTWFPIQSERKRLQTQAYLAVEGLRRGNPTAAAHLLQNRWSAQLLDWTAHRSATPNPNGPSNVTPSSTKLPNDGSAGRFPEIREMTHRNRMEFTPHRGTTPGPPGNTSNPADGSKNWNALEPPRQNKIQPTKAVEDSPPSVAERIRSWLPRPLRF